MNVQDALYRVTGRLRYNLFATRLLNSAGNRSSSSCVAEAGPLGRARGQPSPGLLPAVGISQSQELTGSRENLARSQSVNCAPSPVLWTSQVKDSSNLFWLASLALVCCCFYYVAITICVLSLC